MRKASELTGICGGAASGGKGRHLYAAVRSPAFRHRSRCGKCRRCGRRDRAYSRRVAGCGAALPVVRRSGQLPGGGRRRKGFRGGAALSAFGRRFRGAEYGRAGGGVASDAGGSASCCGGERFGFRAAGSRCTQRNGNGGVRFRKDGAAVCRTVGRSCGRGAACRPFHGGGRRTQGTGRAGGTSRARLPQRRADEGRRFRNGVRFVRRYGLCGAGCAADGGLPAEPQPAHGRPGADSHFAPARNICRRRPGAATGRRWDRWTTMRSITCASGG